MVEKLRLTLNGENKSKIVILSKSIQLYAIIRDKHSLYPLGEMKKKFSITFKTSYRKSDEYTRFKTHTQTDTNL